MTEISAENTPQKIHFIATGGAIMHNLAIALHKLGHQISGSDDVIYDPAKSRLEKYGLLPEKMGWDAERVHAELDAVILGMHAKPDNPELARAQELGVPVYSFPEYIFKHSRHKQRVVIAGSHGKTTITSMILHVLRGLGRDMDYLVGAQLDGFETMVRLSEDAPVIVMEGDEYLASPIDRRPKFLLYEPHIVLVSGIAWDHINVFPTEEEYNFQFNRLLRTLPKAGTVVFNAEDDRLVDIVKSETDEDLHYLFPYETPQYRVENGLYVVRCEGVERELQIVGKHNLANLAGAWEVCRNLAVTAEAFMDQMSTFTGAAKRLERIHDDGNSIIFRDFAHSPSKVKATVEGVADLYGTDEMVAVLELHTFSSLNKAFLPQYKDTLKSIPNKVVFIDQETLARKNYPEISQEELREAFGEADLKYAGSVEELEEFLAGFSPKPRVWLMMSSGNFAGWGPKSVLDF